MWSTIFCQTKSFGLLLWWRMKLPIGVFEFFGGTMNAASKLLVCQRRGPAFDEAEPLR
jgi:hypothetical protein